MSEPENTPTPHELLATLAAHGKELIYLLLGLVCVWAVGYSVRNAGHIDASVLELVGLIYGTGAAVKGWKAHVENRHPRPPKRDGEV